MILQAIMHIRLVRFKFKMVLFSILPEVMKTQYRRYGLIAGEVHLKKRLMESLDKRAWRVSVQLSMKEVKILIHILK